MQKKTKEEKVSRNRKGPLKKWTDDESLSVLHYVLDKKNDGKPFEKPTAPMYYEKMIERLKLDVKWPQIKAKMRHFRGKYVEIKKWLDSTGQGVDSGTIEEYKAAKCKFYYLLDDIFCTKANVSIPYMHDSLLNQNPLNDEQNLSEPVQNTVNGTNDDGDNGYNAINDDGDNGYNGSNDDGDNGYNAINDDGDNGYNGSNDDGDNGYNGTNDDGRINSNEEENSECPQQPKSTTENQRMDDDYAMRYIIDSAETIVQQNDVGEVAVHLDLSTINIDSFLEMDSDVETVNSFVLRKQSSTIVENRKVQEPQANGPVVTKPKSSINKTANKTALTQKEIEDINFARFAASPRRKESDEDDSEQNSRIARYKKQLSERPSGKPVKSDQSKIPSNSAAFLSDANMKRTETLKERNQIEMQRVENEKFEMATKKRRFEMDILLEKAHLDFNNAQLELKGKEISLKEKEQNAKFELRQKNFDLKARKLDIKEQEKKDEAKLKILELEKSERLETLKLKYEFELQLEIAKLKKSAPA